MAIANGVCEEHDKKIGSKTALDSHRLKEAEAILKLSKALVGKFLHFYVYGAVEGEVLVMYLSHPAMLMEFKGQKEVILEGMRKIYVKEKMKDVLKFKDVRVAVKPKPAQKKETKEPYQDRATGNLEIRVEDDALRRKFESIRRTIREGHDGK